MLTFQTFIEQNNISTCVSIYRNVIVLIVSNKTPLNLLLAGHMTYG